VQTLTVREGPLHRLFGRASVRVETAGGVAAGDGGSDRAWLAPIVARAALPRLAAQILPGFDFDALEWQPVDPRAFRRVVKRTVLVALAFTGLAAVPFGVRALVLLPPALALAVFVARRGVANLAWAVTGEAVVFRSGILARQTSVARMSKIQAVARRTSPFDRRAAMARVSVDTAGAREAHRVDIPYLGVETARRLHAHLAAQASRTAFRW
jgi:putative membrane protein